MRRSEVLLAGLAGVLLATGGNAAFGAAVCSPTTFLQPRFVSTAAPWSEPPVAGDWNGDGKTDLAGMPTSGSGVAVLPGNGSGGFGPPIVTAGQFGVGLVAGHFDAGATLDIALMQYPNVAVLPGHGDGTFGAPITTAINDFSPGHFVAADLDGDGKLDLVAFTPNDNRVMRLLGNGDGTFQPLIVASLSGSVEAVAVADLDGDGRPDLAVAQSDGVVGVLLGRPGGNFSDPSFFVVGPFASAIAAADLDGDGVLDLVATTGQFVAALRGLGDGSFEAAILFEAGENPQAFTVGDFNEDGVPDVAVVGSGGIMVLAGDGAGGFRAPVGFVAGIGPAALLAASFDGDTHLDLAVTSAFFSGSQTSILRGEGDGRFDSSLLVDPDGGSVVGEGDFTRDGRPDLLVFSQGFPEQMGVFAGTGDGRFEKGPSTTVGVFFDRRVVIADFDGDLAPDVAVVVGSEIAVYLSHSDGTFSDALTISSPLVANVSAIAAGDWKKDGNTDLAIVSTPFGGGSTYVAVFPGNGDGTFGDAIQTPLSASAGGVIPAFIDSDDALDAVYSGVGTISLTADLKVLFGNGDGTFVEGVTLVSASTSARVGDFDGDGIPDIVASVDQQQQIQLLLGNGDGTFQEPVLVGLSGVPVDLAVADFDGDTHLDVATANVNYSTVNLLRGFGNGHFRAPETYRTSTPPNGLVLGDFLAGGSPDLLAGNTDLLRNSRLAVEAPAAGTRTACAGSSLEFDAHASGFGPLTYQWTKGGQPLADDSRIHGSQTAHLRVDQLTQADGGSYSTTVTDTCSSASGGGGVVDVTSKLPIPALNVPLSVPSATPGLKAAALSDPAHLYAWSLSGGAITGGQGTSEITFTSGQPGTLVKLEVVESLPGNCASSDPAAAEILADYADVPASHPFHKAIVTVSIEGITTGCGGGKYCPDLPVTRDQMSVFIVRGEHGGDYQPPAATGLVFSDVTTGTFLAKWMEQFGHEGISTGCGGGAPPPFCVTSVVTRDAMATFLLRGKLSAAYQPPPATGLVFGDVHTSTFLAKWMEDLKAKGITSGCGNGNYCPTGLVSRGEMAVLVMRTFLSP